MSAGRLFLTLVPYYPYTYTCSRSNCMELYRKFTSKLIRM